MFFCLIFIFCSIFELSLLFGALDNKNINNQKQINEIKLKKNKLKSKIQNIEKILKTVDSKKKVTLRKLTNSEAQIKTKQKLIKLNTIQIHLINKNLIFLQYKTYKLLQKIEILKKEYSKIIYDWSKLLLILNKIIFIFSSKTFNEMFHKISYLHQYANSRRNYYKKILELKNNLKIQNKILAQKKKYYTGLISQNQTEKNKLLLIKQKYNSEIKELSQKTKVLKKDLQIQNNAYIQLDKILSKLFLNDNSIDKNEQKKGNLQIPYQKPQNKIINFNRPKFLQKKIKDSSIIKSKGKLPWPVHKGFISKKFGKSRHPILKHITIQNHGIDIQTEKNSDAFCVFPGIVKKVVFIPGMNNIVIVNHGQYYTVYANLDKVYVKTGQNLYSGKALGRIFTNDEDGITELQFQIRKKTQTLNPQHWLKK